MDNQKALMIRALVNMIQVHRAMDGKPRLSD
jgi:hypothetical protein